MKFGVIVSDKKAEVHEHDAPTYNENQVLVKNKACNICTSDYQQWLGLRPHQKTPMAFGHENAGVVFKVGANVKNVSVGDHVVTNVYQPCMQCENCRKNKNSMFCLNSNLKPLEANEHGYYGIYACSEYMVMESKHVYRVKKDIPFEQLAFSEPLATVVCGIEQLEVKPSEKILVIGAGTMGMLNALLARFYGADIIISDISSEKIENAKAMGFEQVINPLEEDYNERINELTFGKGVDAVIIAVGASAAYKQALDVSKSGGRLLIFAAGYPEPKWEMDPNLVHYKQLKVIGTYGCRPSDFQYATELLGDGSINVERLVEKKVPLNDIQGAFEAATQKDAFRVSVMI